MTIAYPLNTSDRRNAGDPRYPALGQCAVVMLCMPAGTESKAKARAARTAEQRDSFGRRSNRSRSAQMRFPRVAEAGVGQQDIYTTLPPHPPKKRGGYLYQKNAGFILKKRGLYKTRGYKAFLIEV
jgi:hypothetical protein